MIGDISSDQKNQDLYLKSLIYYGLNSSNVTGMWHQFKNSDTGSDPVTVNIVSGYETNRYVLVTNKLSGTSSNFPFFQPASDGNGIEYKQYNYSNDSDVPYKKVTYQEIVNLINKQGGKKILNNVKYQTRNVNRGEQLGAVAGDSSNQKHFSSSEQNDDNLLKDSDFDSGWLSNKLEMQALLYFGSHNPKASGSWSDFRDVIDQDYTVYVQLQNNSDSLVLTSVNLGGVDYKWPTIAVAGEELSKPIHERYLTFNPSYQNPVSATDTDIKNFINSAGGKKAIANIKFKIVPNDPNQTTPSY